MKFEQKEECRRLRKEQGLSLKQITRIVGVSQSSVSKWVRDIELTKEQKEQLLLQNPLFNRQLVGSNKIAETSRNKRFEYQEEGKEKAKQKSWLHMIGCMLYWAEGSKKKNVLVFSNSDLNMMKLFLRFLLEEMNIKKEEIAICINVHINNGISLEQIEEYWVKELDLAKTCLRKSTVSRLPRMSSGKKKNKLPYGVARIAVCNTRIIQHIFGAIQEYGNFSNDKWLG